MHPACYPLRLGRRFHPWRPNLAKLTGLASPANRAVLRLRIECVVLLTTGLFLLTAAMPHLTRPSGYVLDGVILAGAGLLMLGRLVSRRDRFLGTDAHWGGLPADLRAALTSVGGAARGGYRPAGAPTSGEGSGRRTGIGGAAGPAGEAESGTGRVGPAPTVPATYRGGVIVPETPLDLAAGARLRVYVVADPAAGRNPVAPGLEGLADDRASAGRGLSRVSSHSHLLPWLIFIIFTAIYFASGVGVMNSADASQYALAQSIVDRRSLNIDPYQQYINPDYSSYKNHVYSNRNPGESFLLVPFYIMAKIIAPISNMPYGGDRPGIDSSSKTEVFTAISSNMSAAGILVVLYHLSFLMTRNMKASFLAVLSLGLGTLLWKYSATFQRQTLVSLFMISSILCLWKFHTILDKNLYRMYVALIGVMCGLAFLCDPVVVFMLPTIITGIIFISKRNGFPLANGLVIFGIFMCIFVLINQLYYFLIFDSFFVTARHFESGPTKWWLRDARFIFQSPLQHTLPVVLFSNDSIPKEAIAAFVWNDPALRRAESAEFATRIKYLGLFSLSPYLWLSVSGYYGLIKADIYVALAFLGMVVGNLLPMAAYTMFYNPNSYDTRFFLPSAVALTAGMPFAARFIAGVPGAPARLVLFGMMALAIAASVWNGWIGILAHYAPHVTGERRFDLDRLELPAAAGPIDAARAAGVLAWQTFPNAANVHLLAIYFALAAAMFYGARAALRALPAQSDSGRTPAAVVSKSGGPGATV